MEGSSNAKKRSAFALEPVGQGARMPLRETNNNVPSPILKKAKLNKPPSGKSVLSATTKPYLAQAPAQSQQQSQSQTHTTSKTSRLAGADLFHWQQSWKKIMKESVVYFEGVEEHNPLQHSEYKKASRALKQVGCKITPFYDNNVTIIISRRQFNPNKTFPSNDIFSNAVSLKTKVWDYEKVFRFLKYLGVLDQDNAIINSTKNNTSNNLYNLLKEEKLFGATDRDPNTKRYDFHYLDKNYLYVYDLAQKVRPIAIREWNDDLYPTLNLTLDGKCPFIPDATENSDRKKLRRLQKFEATKEYRKLLKKCTHDILNSTKSDVSLASSSFKEASTSTDKSNDDEVTISEIPSSSRKQHNDNNDLLEAEQKTDQDFGNENNENGDEGSTKLISKVTKYHFKKPIPLLRNSSCVQQSNSKYFDVASGYNGASNAVNFSMDSTLNSNALQGNGLGPTVSQVPSRNLNNLKRRIIVKKQKQPHHSDREKDFKPGYCENCRVKYDHFDDHIASNRHRNFACENRNFKDIDKLIEVLNESKSLGFVTSNGDYKYV